MIVPETISTKIKDGTFVDNAYHKCFISVFDHWLNEDEAEEQIISYQSIKKRDINDSKFILYHSFEEKFLVFFKDLFLVHEIYGFEEGREVFLRIKNQNFIEQYCLKTLRDYEFSHLYIKELDVFIEGGYDFTFSVFFKLKASLNVLKTLVSKHGFYILKDK